MPTLSSSNAFLGGSKLLGNIACLFRAKTEDLKLYIGRCCHVNKCKKKIEMAVTLDLRRQYCIFDSAIVISFEICSWK